MSTLPHQAIATFGEAHQILKRIEELQELTIELAASLSTENGCDELDRLSIIRRALATAEIARAGFKVHRKDIDAEHLTRGDGMSEITIQIVAYRCSQCNPSLPCTLIVAGDIISEPDYCPYDPTRYTNWKLLSEALP